MINSTLIDKAVEAAPLTDTEKKNSDAVIEESKDLDASTVSRSLDIALEKDNSVIRDEVKDMFKDCNT